MQIKIKNWKKDLGVILFVLFVWLTAFYLCLHLSYMSGRIAQRKSQVIATPDQIKEVERGIEINNALLEMITYKQENIEKEIEYWQGAYYLCNQELTNKREENEPQKSQKN